MNRRDILQFTAAGAALAVLPAHAQSQGTADAGPDNKDGAAAEFLRSRDALFSVPGG
ncbi:twin-arginine translocation signal domain-containing protein [Halomonas flagellata]|uniref:twin-arginine translocation signal domain-containing protein n=1 Tax=Halomonas flagellata TaxID=2920385 RepID=UPI0034E01CBB